MRTKGSPEGVSMQGCQAKKEKKNIAGKSVRSSSRKLQTEIIGVLPSNHVCEIINVVQLHSTINALSASRI